MQICLGGETGERPLRRRTYPSAFEASFAMPAHGLTHRRRLWPEMDVAAHDALRARALPGQPSRSVSVVTVSTCSPKRFR
jgi:hypothetical protein